MADPSMRVLIAGSGPAGLAAANRLSRDSRVDLLILEKEHEPGGLMRSVKINGFIFDWAGHIFFTSLPHIRSWVENLLGDNFHWQNRESWIFSKNTYTRYPFQANTYGLPAPVIKECLMGLIEATYRERSSPPGNFRDWILEVYGEGIARHFMFPYNTKLWARDLSRMDTSWLEGRVPKPGLRDFIDGALSPGRSDMGPNARFGYPLHGGTASLVHHLVEPIRCCFRPDRKMTRLHPRERWIETQNGERHEYDHLVYTGPLPELLGITEGLPDDIRRQGAELDHLSVCCVNVGVNRPGITHRHWIYFPEPDFIFHRVFVQGNASPFVCPPGGFSYTAEITTGPAKELNRETILETTLAGLVRAGLLEQTDDIIASGVIDIPYGYIVPAHRNAPIVDAIRSYYSHHAVSLCGRFAEWAYYNMDHAMDAGLNTAERILDSIG